MFTLTNSQATLPKRATVGSAGYDLYSTIGFTLEPGERITVDTGVIVSMPAGHCGQIWPRSGWAHKAGIDVLGGLIDEDYNQTVGVILINHGYGTYSAKQGDRIAQLVISPYYKGEDVRKGRTGGYGSTG